MRRMPVDSKLRNRSGGAAKVVLLVMLTVAAVAGVVLMAPHVISDMLVTHVRLRFAPEAGKSSEPIEDPVLPPRNSEDVLVSPSQASPEVSPSDSHSQLPVASVSASPPVTAPDDGSARLSEVR